MDHYKSYLMKQIAMFFYKILFLFEGFQITHTDLSIIFIFSGDFP